MIGIAAGLLLAAATPPDEPPPPPDAILKPEWAVLPTGPDIAAVYPEGAQRQSTSGWAILYCTAASNGVLVSCRIAQESPPGFGFGEATVRLAGKFAAKPKKADGTSQVGVPLRLKVRYEIHY